MPRNPLDVEAQGAQLDTRDSSGNQWLLSSLYFLSRLLELAFSLWGLFAVISVTGADSKCEKTTAGPGSDICTPTYKFDKFESAVFLVVVLIGSSIWSLFIFFAIMMKQCFGSEFCTGKSELVQNALDTLCSGLNAAAFIWCALALTSSQPDVNQGDSVLESMVPTDAQKMQMGIAMSFLLFVGYAGSLGLNMKLYTKN